VASLAASIESKLGIKPVLEPGALGELDVFADGDLIATQHSIAGIKARITGPNEEEILAEIRRRMAT